MADPARWLPATAQNWTTASPGVGGQIDFARENPEWTAQQLQQAQAQRQYLDDLMARQAPWMLNPNLVGKGMPDDPQQSGLMGSLYPLMRMASEATIGQPYGMLVPPSQSDVAAADSAVSAAGDRNDMVQRIARALAAGGR